MLIDVNVSLGRWPFQKFRLDTPAKLAHHLKSEQISRAYVSPIESVLYPDPTVYNDILIKKLKPYPSLISISVINPILSNWNQEIAKIDRRKAKAIKVLPNYHRYNLADKCVDELMSELAKRKIVLIIQIRIEDERSQYPLMKVPGVDCNEVIKLAKRFRSIPIICLCPYFAEAVSLTKGAPNIYTDIAFTEYTDTLADLLAQAPAKQILFGSHTPFLYTDAAIMKIKAANITKKDNKSISSANIHRLL